ncbi:hypothetical protein Tco_0932400, partial [Tanacetum coccineum]
RNTKPKVVPIKQWKPTGRLIPLRGQCPLVRPAALNRGTMPADLQGNNTPVEYNLVCSNQQPQLQMRIYVTKTHWTVGDPRRSDQSRRYELKVVEKSSI